MAQARDGLSIGDSAQEWKAPAQSPLVQCTEKGARRSASRWASGSPPVPSGNLHLAHQSVQVLLDSVHRLLDLGPSRRMFAREFVQGIQCPNHMVGIAERINGVEERGLVTAQVRRVDAQDRGDGLLDRGRGVSVSALAPAELIVAARPVADDRGRVVGDKIPESHTLLFTHVGWDSGQNATVAVGILPTNSGLILTRTGLDGTMGGTWRFCPSPGRWWRYSALDCIRQPERHP